MSSTMAATALLLLALLLVAAPQRAAAELERRGGKDIQEPVWDAPSNAGLKPERWSAYNVTQYYQMIDGEDAKGTIVFFHGCSRTARAFWPFHPTECPECMGFPEHVSHTKQALAAGFNVVVMDPTDDKHECWSSVEREGYANDQPLVVAALAKFVRQHALGDRPVYLWGASSGGTFALKMPGTIRQFERAEAAEGTFALRVDGIISEVACPENFGAFDAEGKLRLDSYPPTVFVRMQRDGSDEDADRAVAAFRANGVPSGVITARPRVIGPRFFSKRSPTITDEQSERIVWGLRKIGLLDEEGRLTADPDVKKDPKLPSYQWELALHDLLPELALVADNTNPLSLIYRTSGIHQSLYVAYARHEAVSDYFTACLKWLQSGGEGDVAGFAQRWAVPDGNLAQLTMRRAIRPNSAD